MKFFFIPAFIFISVTSFSQNKFASQMDAIIKDTVNRFKTLKGKFNENPKMGWPYHSSKSDIEGTYDNRVNLFDIRSFYSARVVNPNKGDSILTDK